MKKISRKALGWVRSLLLVSVCIWASTIFLVAAFDIKSMIIPMWISWAVMNALNIIKVCNE